MDLDAKIGQLFVVGAQQPDVVRQVRDNQVGGVIWFATTTAEAARTNAELQALALVPLLVSADLEAGMGMRFIDADWWPPAMAIAATGDVSLAEEMGRATAREALAIGVNHILAPVADVNVDPRNPVINTRSFGEDPHEVARYVAAFIRGVQGEGCLATAKHFPGHGDTHVDSHRALPVLDVTRERLDAVELVPFRAAIEAGVASVMLGHLSVPVLDDTPAPVLHAFANTYGTRLDEVTRAGTLPATLSPRIVALLRALGFTGLAITDAMDMGGLAAHFDPAEAAVRAVEAGMDQVLFSPDTDAAIAGLREAVRVGRIPMARIDEAVGRIMEAKTRCGAPASSPAGPQGRSVEAFRSITLVRDTSGLLPLRSRNLRVVTVSPHEDDLTPALRELDAAEGDDVLLLLLALRPKSGAGSITVPEEIRALVREHAQKTIAVVFGSPYVLRELGDVSTFVCAWGVQPVLQVAAIRGILGKQRMDGTLPVTLGA